MQGGTAARGKTLQWGRARGSAESVSSSPVAAVANTLQWGRARGSAER